MTVKTAIMGFGNPCRSDDAVGIYVIDELKKQLHNNEHITVIDMGTGAFELLFQLKGHQKIILVDAVLNTGEKPGTLYKVPASEVMSAPQDDPMVFLHSLKWDQALSYAKKIMGSDYPEDITVYLVAVDDTRLEIRLSEEVRTAGDKVAGLIMKEIPAEQQKTGMAVINGHLIVPVHIAGCLFENAAQVNWVYYPQKGSMLIVSQYDDLFKSLHKTNMSMLKYKNGDGDRSISIQELILDNELDNGDRYLPFIADERMKILTVTLK